MTTITFVVLGSPQTAGSKQSFVPLNKKTREPFRRPNGGIVVSTVDDNPKGKGWKKLVAAAAKRVYQGPLLDGPLAVRAKFYRPRPKSHYRSNGELNKTGLAKPFPTAKPDATKLWRCAEDALNKTIWVDDSIVVDQHVTKHWGEPARLEVEIKQLVESEVLLFETRVEKTA